MGSQGRWGLGTNPAKGNNWGWGYVWLCGDCWNMAPVYFHELGHNVSCFHYKT